MSTTKPPRKKRPPLGMERIRAAVDAVAAKGKTPTLRTVRAELTRHGRGGASFSDILPAVNAWRMQTLQRVSGRVENAVAALLALETDLERDAVRAAVHARTGGGVNVRFTVTTRWRGGGRPGNVRQRAAQAAGGEREPR